MPTPSHPQSVDAATVLTSSPVPRVYVGALLAIDFKGSFSLKEEVLALARPRADENNHRI